MKFEKPNQFLVFLLILASFCFLFLGEAFGKERFLVSIPAEKILEHLQNGKRISGYTISLANSEVYGLTKIQPDWLITISNHHFPLGDERISAEAGHGVSWMTDADVKNGAFNEFLIVEREKGEREPINVIAEFEIEIPSEDQEVIVKIIIGSEGGAALLKPLTHAASR